MQSNQYLTAEYRTVGVANLVRHHSIPVYFSTQNKSQIFRHERDNWSGIDLNILYDFTDMPVANC
jgi:hypothetical protein